jgi:hypothetical protein
MPWPEAARPEAARPEAPWPEAPAHPRRWLGRGLLALSALVVVVVAVAALAFTFAPAPAPLSLPSAPVAAPTGPLDGTWAVGPGSVAGFRVAETVLFMTREDVVGRTSAVAGSCLIVGQEMTQAGFRVDLRKIKIGGKSEPQFAKSLATTDHPYATFAMTGPVALGAAFGRGGTVRALVRGRLSMDGRTHLVSITVSGHRDGADLQVAGYVPVAFSAWGIGEPGGLGPLGSLADRGVAQFLLQLHRENLIVHSVFTES